VSSGHCAPIDVLGDKMQIRHADFGDLVVVLQSGACGFKASPLLIFRPPASRRDSDIGSGNAMSGFTLNRRHVFWVFLAYLAFVVYGSLVPFRLRSYTFDQAVWTFSTIHYLSLGVASRADWVANIVLYVPLAFLGCTWLAGRGHAPASRILAVILVFVVCLAVAIALEFTQIFFAPRTVSLNDLLAETLGTLAGIGMWILWRDRLADLLKAFSEGGRQSVLAVITIYTLAYIALTLFPYDLLVSLNEVTAKLASKKWGWFLAGSCGSWIRCLATLVAEMAATAPLGVLLALAAPRPLSFRRLFLAGVLLGLVLELLQLLLASGISQGLSLATRGIGLVAGATLGHALRSKGPAAISRLVWRLTAIAALPYLIAVAAVHGWFSRPWLSLEAAFGRLADVRLMPFYYHYFTTEPKAMASLLAQAVTYAPVGVAVWARHFATNVTKHKAALNAIWPSAVLAMIIELGKLWVPPRHPDFTNVLIACVSAVTAYAFARWVAAVLVGGTQIASRTESLSQQAVTAIRDSGTASNSPSTPTADKAQMAGIPSSSEPNPIARSYALTLAPKALSRAVAFVFFGAGVSLAYSLPGLSLPLVVILLAYSALLARYPATWLLLLPSVFAAFNFAPWTGWFFFDESDAFVLVTLGVFLWQKPLEAVWFRKDALNIAILSLAAAYIISTLLVLLPPPPLDANAFANYYSPLNALRISKSLLWMLLLWPVLYATANRDLNVGKLFSMGLLLALFAVTLTVLWERWAYVGLFDFSSDHRVTGSFASMHTGGAFLDGFLVLAIPFVLLPFRWPTPWPAVALSLATMALYATVVTYSRGTYAALVIGALVFAIAAAARRRPLTRTWSLTAALTLFMVMAATVFVMSQGQFMQSRWGTTIRDVQVRMKHWRDAISLMDNNFRTFLFGMGPGSFPATYFWRNRDDVRLASFWIDAEHGRPYLRTNTGQPMFLDQRIDVDPYREYTLTVNYRSEDPKLRLKIGLCEKSLLFSYGCSWYEVGGHEAGDWIQVSRRIVPDDSNIPWKLVRSHVISIALSGPPGRVDLRLVRLQDPSGKEYVANGNFSSGMDHWFFVVDNHLPWHIKNLWVSQYFDTGLFGTLALLLFGSVLVSRLARQVRRGDLYTPVFFSSLAGIATVGMVDSPFDDPRLGLIVWLSLLVAGDRRFVKANH
jgi:glycopeptide antibiotics resistance protein